MPPPKGGDCPRRHAEGWEREFAPQKRKPECRKTTVVWSDANFSRPDVEKTTVVWSDAGTQWRRWSRARIKGLVADVRRASERRKEPPSGPQRSTQPWFFRHLPAESLHRSTQPWFFCKPIGGARVGTSRCASGDAGRRLDVHQNSPLTSDIFLKISRSAAEPLMR